MTSKFHLLEVVPYYEPAWAFGGPPRVMADEAKALVRRGNSVSVFTTDVIAPDERLRAGRSVEDGVDVHRFPNVSNRLAYERLRFSPRGMRRALRTLDHDVVHLSELRHELAVLSWKDAARRRIPFVVSAHGTAPRRSGTGGHVRSLYDRAFVTPMVKGSAALFAQTNHEAALYLDYGVDPERVHVVPLGVSVPDSEGTTPDLGVPDDARVILFLGRIHKLKGVERLITGYAAIADAFPDTWLVIAGRDDGAETDARALADRLGISDRVSFPGPIYGPARFNAYRRAEVFALTPIHYEETSLATLEAASVGAPLLVGAEAEAPFLEEFGGGETVPEGQDVAPALSRMLSGDLASMSKGAREMVAAKHDWHQVGELVESLIARAIDG